MHPALLVAFLAAPSFAAAPAPEGSEAACLESAALQPPTVFEVVAKAYPTIIERGFNIKEINILRPVQLPPKAIAHGLSVADYQLHSTTKSEANGWGPDGRACAWIGSVVVNLTPESIRIYIPEEYRPDSCESKQLLLHEMEHEKLYRQGLQKAVDRMRFALAHAPDLPGPKTPIDAATPEEAYARLKRMVDQVVRPVYEDFLKTTALEQRTFDSPETYRRLGASCSGWKRT